MTGLAALAPFLPLVVPDGRTIAEGFYCDYNAFQVPFREFAREEILAGRFPLWNPYLACGVPIHAGQQASLCHPVVTPLVLAMGANQGLKTAVVLHLAACFAGQYLLARSLGASRGAAVFAAVAATQSTFVVTHLMEGHVFLILQYSLLPWFFWCLVALCRSSGPRPALGLALTTALATLAGHPQCVYYMALFGALWLAGSLAVGAASACRVRCIAWAAAAAALGSLLAAVQIIPAAELLSDGFSASGRGTAGYAATGAIQPIELLRFVWPNVTGNPLAGVPEFEPGRYFHEGTTYLGLATPILAVFGLSRVTAKRWQWGAAALCALAVVVALGDNTALFEALGTAFQGLFWYRCPGRALLIVSVLAPLLGATGLDALVYGDRAARDYRLWLWLATLWFSGCWLACRVIDVPNVLSDYRSYAAAKPSGELAGAATLSALTLVTLLACRLFGPNRPRLAYLATTAVALLDLSLFAFRCVKLEAPQAMDVAPSLAAAGPDVRFVGAKGFPDVSSIDLRYCKLAAQALRLKRPTVCTFDGGVLPRSVERLYDGITKNPEIALPVSACEYACRRSTERCTWLGEPLPRARLLRRGAAEMLDIPLGALDNDDLRRLKVAELPRVRIVEERPMRLTLRVDAPEDSVLVLADTHYRGWRCVVNEREAPISPAHGAFRSVRVAKGSQRVVFFYRAESFALGGAVTGLGTCLSVVLAVFALRESPNENRGFES